MYLALTDLFRAKWTDAIHQEWMRNVRQDYPDMTRAQVERIRDLMNAHVRDCLVTGYEPLIPGYSGWVRVSRDHASGNRNDVTVD